MLFKVQVDDTGTSALIYNKQRDIMFQTEDQDLIRELNPQLLPAKYYMEGEIKNGRIRLNLDSALSPDKWPDW